MDAHILTEVLLHQRKYNVDGSVYKLLQIQFACDSNRIEGNKLTREQTETIFARNVISGNDIKVDDIIDIKSHFEAFDYLLDNVNAQMAHELFHKLHFLLKKDTTDTQNSAFVVGAYKKNENTIGSFTGVSQKQKTRCRSNLAEILKWCAVRESNPRPWD